MNQTWRIGENGQRPEDRALLRGETHFFADRQPDECLVMAIVRSPVACGSVAPVDLKMVKATPGVALVIAPADLPNNGPLPAADLVDTSLPAFQPVLADGWVLYAGQPVLAIVAETPSAAARAARAVSLAVAPGPAVLSVGDALAEDAARLHATASNAVHVLEHRVGDPEAAFAEAAHVIEENVSFHRVCAAPMEPRGVEAHLDPESGILSVTATTQIPGIGREAVARLLELDVEQVRYERLPLGGGFGCKEAFYPEEVLAAFAALRLGRRVRWQESRAEHFVATSHGRQGEALLRMALDDAGIVTALALDSVSDIGAAYGFAGNSPGAALGAMVRGPYCIPNFAARTRSVVTNKTPLNVYRGAGHPQAVLAMERMMDRAAQLLGQDRVKIRRRNLIAAEAFPIDRGVSYPGAGRIVYDSGQFERCLDEALSAIGAAEFDVRRAGFEAENPALRLGFGLSIMVELTSTGPDESIELSVADDGTIVVETANVEIGQRTGSALAQILSDRLGIDPQGIEVRCGGSRIRRSGGGTYASRGAAVTGAAVADGAERLKQTAIALAAAHFGSDAEKLDWAEGGIVGLPGRNAPFSLGDLRALLPHGAPLRSTGSFEVPASTFASAAHAAIVSVDIETGVVGVLDYAVAHDCGRVLNPRGVEDQIVGGVMQGIGATLFEDLPYSDAGAPLVRGFMDYTLPVAADVPRFHLRHVETPSPVNPLGLKGAGEGGFTGAPAALVGAIEDALRDFRVFLHDDGPYTPSRVLALIRDASSVPLASNRKSLQ